MQHAFNGGQASTNEENIAFIDLKTNEEAFQVIKEPSPSTDLKNGNLSEDKIKNKRSRSCTRGTRKFSPFHQRRHRERNIPPTKFLLGGNIRDPLNLRSMQDEEVNKVLNASTPVSSPLPTPEHWREKIEVMIPPNVNDPLSLMDCRDDAKYEQNLTLHNMSTKREQDNITLELTNDFTEHPTSAAKIMSTSEDNLAEESETQKKEEESSTDRESSLKRCCEFSGDVGGLANGKKKKQNNPIVSPAVPQPGSWKTKTSVRAGNQVGHKKSRNKSRGSNQQMPKFQAKNAKFQYGNYSRYYGYRNLAHEVDPRLKCFAEMGDTFRDKDVLDIGCNIGHITLSVAREFRVKSIVGLDIDRSLIDIARKNVKHYVKYMMQSPTNSSRNFPASMSILYRDVNLQHLTGANPSSSQGKFPDNVSFVQGNYVLESDDLLATEREQFDVILCLSLTKWIHLNWGDSGLKRAFKRMYRQLRPDGKLILEIQPYDSYKRKKTLTETLYKNFNSMEFFPNQFIQFLLSPEVGFIHCETIGKPHHQSKGFQRPIHMLSKDGLSSRQSPAKLSGAEPNHSTSNGQPDNND